MAEESESEVLFFADEDVFLGKKRTQREIIKSTILGQNYYSPAAKGSSTSANNLPDVINDSAERKSLVHDESNEQPEFSNNEDNSIIIIDSDSPNDDYVQVISDDESFNEICSSLNQELDVDKSKDLTTSSCIVPKEDKSFETNRSSEEKQSLQETSSLDEWNNVLSVIPELKSHANEMQVNESALSIESLIKASKILEEEESAQNKISESVSSNDPDLSILSNLDFSALTGVQDILNISHGSSLPSPAVNPNNSSLGLLANVVYENISCDENLMFDNLGPSSCKKPRNEDLHMSVDEIDCINQDMHKAIEISADISQSTFYKSCINEKSGSDYYTANNTQDSSSQHPTESFSSYRVPLDESVFVESVNHTNDLEVNKENETSFEIVVNNRQNSFTHTVVGAQSESSLDKPKQYASKLPVYNCPTNVLKPSLLKVDTEKLKEKSTKWAKNLAKTCPTSSRIPTLPTETKSTTKVQPRINKTIGKTPNKTLPVNTSKNVQSESEKKTAHKNIPKTLAAEKKITPAKTAPDSKILTKQTLSKTPLERKSPSKSILPGLKLMSSSKTPNTLANKAAKTVSTDPKTPNLIQPTDRNLLSSGKKIEHKNRFKDIISPVRAYITSSPITMQRKVHVPEKQYLVTSGRKVESHIPIPANTPISTKIAKATSSSVSSSRVALKLTYGNPNGQENVDPNYSRDTLPPRVFEPAAAVFMKESELPKRHFPRMGETMSKLIDTPRPKVVVHQGRSKDSPRSKGVLIPAINVIQSTPDHQTDQPDVGNISIRVEKTAEHPRI